MEEVVVSSLLVGATIGAVIGGALTNRYGRRIMIILAGIIFTMSAIGTAFAPSVNWLIAGRMIGGIAIGIASFISPMYIGELVPAKVRGSPVAVNMLAITTGIVIAYRQIMHSPAVGGGGICLALRLYRLSDLSLACGF